MGEALDSVSVVLCGWYGRVLVFGDRLRAKRNADVAALDKQYDGYLSYH